VLPYPDMDSHSPPPTVSICQVESNLPGEDRYCIRVTEDIYTYGVYDGHGGYLAADMACAMLQDMIISEISLLNMSERTDLKIASIINTSFCSCDEKIVAEALNLHTACRNNSFSAKSLPAKGIDKFGSKVSPPTDPILSDMAYMLERQVVPKIMGRAGSCAAIVVITGGMIFVAHVGLVLSLISELVS
jgi:hypothetical protein